MDNLIAISEMAKLYGITRQTLIYYDEIGLFKPVQVDEKGYRYYSVRQVPYLREICFLKSIGVGLQDIVEHFRERSASKEMQLLLEQRTKILQELSRLNKLRNSISQRIRLYEQSVEAEAGKLREPFMHTRTPKRVLFKEYVQPINRENLHITVMTLWRQVFQKELVPCSGFGSLFRKDDVLNHQALASAGSCLFLPVWNNDYPESFVLEPCECACMYKYGMPYDTESIEILMDWIDMNGYELCGDILDTCLLDTTFYKDETTMDYCLLEAPVRPKSL